MAAGLRLDTKSWERRQQCDANHATIGNKGKLIEPAIQRAALRNLPAYLRLHRHSPKVNAGGNCATNLLPALPVRNPIR